MRQTTKEILKHQVDYLTREIARLEGNIARTRAQLDDDETRLMKLNCELADLITDIKEG